MRVLPILFAAYAWAAATAAAAAPFQPGDVVVRQNMFSGAWDQKYVVVKEINPNLYRVHLQGSTYATDTIDVPPRELRPYTTGGATAAAARRTTAAAPPAGARNRAPCDWSAWGVMNEANLVALAGERELATEDLVCQVRTRKVNFRLTPALERKLGRHATPGLLAAVRESFKGAPAAAAQNRGSNKAVSPGRYACSKMAGIAGHMRFHAYPDITILPGGRYSVGGTAGAFQYDGTRRIRWASGPLAQQGWWGDYAPGVFSVMNAKGQILYSCNRA